MPLQSPSRTREGFERNGERSHQSHGEGNLNVSLDWLRKGTLEEKILKGGTRRCYLVTTRDLIGSEGTEQKRKGKRREVGGRREGSGPLWLAEGGRQFGKKEDWGNATVEGGLPSPGRGSRQQKKRSKSAKNDTKENIRARRKQQQHGGGECGSLRDFSAEKKSLNTGFFLFSGEGFRETK